MSPPTTAPRMTANPVKPSRYRPGKAVEEAASSEEEEEADEDQGDDHDDKTTHPKATARAPPPKATSFPSSKTTAATTSNLKNLDLNARRREELAREQARRDEERSERERREREAGFVTESEEGSEDEDEDEDEDGGEGDATRTSQPSVRKAQARAPPQRRTGSTSDEGSDDEEEESGSEESDSDSSAGPPKMLRPMFVKKSQRANPSDPTTKQGSEADDQAAAEARVRAEAERRERESNALIQARIDTEAAMKAAQSRDWDDEGTGELDDTDGLDPELEHAEWVARELARLKRSRAALEENEAELAEVERRRNLSTPEREAEDNARIAEQQEAKEGKGKAGFMAKYHHRGAFFGDEEDKEGRRLAERDLMGAEYEGTSSLAKEALPKYLQVRDQTMVGRKGRQRHRDLKGEDTGNWGDFGRDGRGGSGAGRGGFGGSFVEDERFRPDRPGDMQGATGANSSSLGERKRPHGHDREEDSKRPRKDGVI